MNALRINSIKTIIQLLRCGSAGWAALGWLIAYAFAQLLHYINPNILLSCKILFHVEFTVTQACTLRCRHCISLIQYFEHPQTFSSEQICSDIDALFKVIKFAVMPRFLGGEPFLNKELATILKYITKYEKQYGLLGITTNATIVPGEDLLTAMKTAKVCVRCSNYGANSRKLSELCAKLTEYRIPFEVECHKWIETHKPVKPSATNVINNWKLCYKSNPCRTVKRGKLYYCGFLSNGEDLGMFPYSNENGIPITGRIWDCLARRYPFPGCEYCGGDGHPVVPAKEQSKMPLPYDKYDNAEGEA